jgi:hypothetical protein
MDISKLCQKPLSLLQHDARNNKFFIEVAV